VSNRGERSGMEEAGGCVVLEEIGGRVQSRDGREVDVSEETKRESE